MRSLFTIILLTLLYVSSAAQEISCKIRITTPKLQVVDPKVFESLQVAMEEYINGQKWTDDIFEQEERIAVNMQLNITEETSPTSFRADLAIQATRPVYGSNYETPLMSHADRDIEFSYEQYQPLEFSRNSFNDNLTSILSFYAYIIIGLDYDTFSPFGGEKYFQIAQDILNTVPNGIKGWSSLDSKRNRYWVVENLLNPRVRPMREAIYQYHMKSLDVMHTDVEKGKTEMLNALQTIGEVNRSYPNAMILQMFSNAKSEEIIEIFKNGSSQQKNKVYQIMAKIDASHASDYRKILR